MRFEVNFLNAYTRGNKEVEAAPSTFIYLSIFYLSVVVVFLWNRLLASLICCYLTIIHEVEVNSGGYLTSREAAR